MNAKDFDVAIYESHRARMDAEFTALGEVGEPSWDELSKLFPKEAAIWRTTFEHARSQERETIAEWVERNAEHTGSSRVVAAVREIAQLIREGAHLPQAESEAEHG